ncbi:MAG: hypothetical protein AABY05_02575 [Nanoarchaeota archaeon]
MGDENFYPGADYGMDSGYNKDYSLGVQDPYQFKASYFGLTTDPRSANQITEVSKKLNTGAKTIEVSGVSPEVLDYIPEQHLTEIYRLKKLVGVDLTFHGPLIEPTGVSRQGWDESQREQAEREMWTALRRAHKIDPKGNIIVTFHSSNGLPDPESRVKTEFIDPVTKEKKTREEIKDFWVVNERDGNFQRLDFSPDYFRSKEKFEKIEDQEKAIKEQITKQNKDAWFRQLQQLSYHANAGYDIVSKVLYGKEYKDEEKSSEVKDFLKYYSDYKEGGKLSEALNKFDDIYKNKVKEKVYALSHGELYLRDAYQDLQTLFNQAYSVAKLNNSEDDMKKLNKYREEMKSKISYLDSKDPQKFLEFAEEIERGTTVLGSTNYPRALKPLKEFAVEKSAKTFANIAYNAYSEFKDTAPIISIENPPAGTGLTRANDLKEVVKRSRDFLVDKLVSEKNLSESEAKRQAEKLIGVTWDVGHINMLRKFGYSEKDIVSETKKVAELVKHVHLSDNFGMQHTELPMGMGNVPVKPMLEAIHKYNDQVKKIIETGGWFQHFKVSPLKESLRAFGSPVYSMQMSPYWNNVADSSGGYFSGYGRMLPETHFSLYGSGFSNLPPELGGQLSGRSRASGAPIE